MDLPSADLKAFVAVAQHGSFTRAAAALSLSQPALSRRISGLEKLLGAKLFSRCLDGIRLTEVGSALLPHALTAETAWRDGIEAVRSASEGENGRLDFAITNSLLNARVIGVLQRLQKDAPGIELNLHAGTSVEVSAWVLRGDASIGLRSRRDADPRLHSETIGEERTVIVASPQHSLAGRKAVSPAQIARETWIATPVKPGEPDGGAHAVLRHYGLKSGRRLMLIDSSMARKRLIEAGFGIGMLAYENVREELDSGRLIPLNVPSMKATAVPVTLIRRRSMHLGPASRRLIGVLNDAFSQAAGQRSRRPPLDAKNR